MSARIGRRGVLRGSAVFAAGAGMLGWARAWAAEQPFQPEKGATLRLLRWSPLVQAEGEVFRRSAEAFSKATGVAVQIDEQYQDNIQPAMSVAANVGSGPDLIWALLISPQQFPDKLVDVTDVADYLGGKYGGWYPVMKEYSVHDGRWISIPVGVNGNLPNYRVSWLKEAGFDAFPKDTDSFLRMCQALQKAGHPVGFPLGHANGDGNAWLHWALWAFGGRVVDERNAIAINSPETIRALEYVKELYPTFIQGTAAWNDAANNKAFLAGDVSVTNNGISIYVSAQRDNPHLAADMNHASFPIGPVGKPTEFHIPYPMMAFRYSRYPNAAKAFIAFMMEAPQYDQWLKSSLGYLTQTLRAYEANPVWTEDPKRLPFRDCTARTLPVSYAGAANASAAGLLANFVVVDMFAAVATGELSPREAAVRAERQARREYR